MTNKLISTTAAIILCGLSTTANADVTGTVDATITLTTGCIINGQAVNDGASSADFGTVDFGSRSSLFVSADSEVVGSGNGIAVQCSPGVSPSLTFGSGEHDGEGVGAGNRAMEHASETGEFVNYGLYTDTGRNSLIAINDSLPLASDGTAQTVRIYGRAFGAAGLPTGTYSDTVVVTLQL
jgi:spore coat protein U-like protein